jgi:plastocyanin domain-containing protein
MLGKEEYAALDKLVSELARTRIDMKFVLYVGIIGVVALVLWWMLARKPKAPAKA